MRSTLWLCVLVIPAASFGACDCGGVVDPVGSWEFSWTVEEAAGLCADEVGEVSDGVIDINAGDTADSYELTGFGDEPTAVLTGTFDNNTLQFEGSYADDTGTTTTSTTLDLSSDGDSLTGTEQWSWESEASPGACPSATSSVTATRR
jgi:hypothetical protein